MISRYERAILLQNFMPEMSSFLRYEGNCGIRNAPEMFWQFRETGPWAGHIS